MNTEKVEALLERIVEVANLALELNIGLQDFCDECCRTVIERLAEAEDAEMQALLQRTPLATPGRAMNFSSSEHSRIAQTFKPGSRCEVRGLLKVVTPEG